VSTRYKKQLLFTKKELLNDVFLRSLTVTCMVSGVLKIQKLSVSNKLYKKELTSKASSL